MIDENSETPKQLRQYKLHKKNFLSFSDICYDVDCVQAINDMLPLNQDNISLIVDVVSTCIMVCCLVTDDLFLVINRIVYLNSKKKIQFYS